MLTVLTIPGGGMPTPAQLAADTTMQFARVGVRAETNRLLVEASIVNDISPAENPVTWAHGTKTVTTAGTPVQLSAAATAFRVVLIVPLRTNTGDAYLGSLSGSGTQHLVAPVSVVAPDGESIDLSKLYLDTIVNGEGVAWEGIT